MDNELKLAQQAVDKGYVKTPQEYLDAVKAGQASARVSADRISTPSITTPQKKTTGQDALSSLNMNVDAMTGIDKQAYQNVQNYTPASETSALEQTSQGLLNKVLGGFEKLTGKKAFVAQQEQDLQLAEKGKQIKDYDNQLLSEQQALKNELDRLEKNPEGKLSGNLNAQMNKVKSESLKRQADIAVLKSVALNDYEYTQNLIDTKVRAEFGDVEDQLDYAQKYLNLITPALNREDKKRADAQQLYLDERNRLLNEDKTKMTQAMQLASDIASNGNTAAAQRVFSLVNSGRYDEALNAAFSSGGLYKAPSSGSFSAGNFQDIIQQAIDAGATPLEAAREAATASENLGIQVSASDLSEFTELARTLSPSSKGETTTQPESKIEQDINQIKNFYATQNLPKSVNINSSIQSALKSKGYSNKEIINSSVGSSVDKFVTSIADFLFK